LLSTALLALAICSEVYAGAQMKRSRGFSDKVASVKAFFAASVCVACCIQLLAHVELSLGWAFYTVFELAGVTIVGVIVEGEDMTCAKTIGLISVLVGSLVFELRVQGKQPAKAWENCEVTLNLILLAGCVLSVLTLMMARPGSTAGDTSSESAAESSTSAAIAETPGRWVRPLCLYGGLTLAAVGEIVLAVCMKEAEGFASTSFSAVSFLVAGAVTCFTIVALKHSSLVIGWLLYTAFEYIGVQLVAIWHYTDNVDTAWVAASMLTLLGVLVLIIEEETDPDLLVCPCRRRRLQELQTQKHQWMEHQEQMQHRLQQRLQQHQQQQQQQHQQQQQQHQHQHQRQQQQQQQQTFSESETS